MTSLTKLYGINYKEQSLNDKVNTIIKNISDNIISKNLNINIDTKSLWDKYNMKPNVINNIINTVKFKSNDDISIHYINKQNPKQLQMLPYLIDETPVEYFYILDKITGNLYFIYISDTIMEIISGTKKLDYSMI